MIPDDHLIALKDRNPVNVVAAQWVTLRPLRRGRYVGPCPICSNDAASTSAGRFECDADTWVCAVCADGGDVIRLVQKREGIDFRAAVDRLGVARAQTLTSAMAYRHGLRDGRTGACPPPPGGYGGRPDTAQAYEDGLREGKRRAEYEAFARQRERKRLHGFWCAASGFAGTPVERYMAGRGSLIHPRAKLRFHAAMPLFADGRERDPVVVHTGPAMLAAIIGSAGLFAGLHITWLDPAGPKGKASVHHPDTGEVLPSKKVRGSKAGGCIDLGCDVTPPRRMIAGEGIETVCGVYTALCNTGALRDGDCFRSGVDLGNLAGRAFGTIAHPTLTTETGRPQRVPGPDPDPASPAMPVPDSVAELILLGDGDSDPFLTRNALARAARRHARPGLRVGVSFAPAGLDFDDLRQVQ